MNIFYYVGKKVTDDKLFLSICIIFLIKSSSCCRTSHFVVSDDKSVSILETLFSTEDNLSCNNLQFSDILTSTIELMNDHNGIPLKNRSLETYMFSVSISSARKRHRKSMFRTSL